MTRSQFYGADSVVHVMLSDDAVVQVRTSGGDGPATGTSVMVEVIGDVLAYASPSRGQRVTLSEACG